MPHNGCAKSLSNLKSGAFFGIMQKCRYILHCKDFKMTIKQLEYYIMTCEKGSITLAAEELYSSRTAISKAIHELEEEFNTQLLQRSKNGVIPTHAGEILLQEAMSIQNGYTYLKNTISSTNAKQDRAIRIAITRSCSNTFYKQFIIPYLEKEPEVSFIIHEYSALEVISRMNAGEYDFAVTSIVADSDRYETVMISANRLCLVAPEDDELFANKEYITIEDLADIPLGFATANVPMEKTLQGIITPLRRNCNIAIKTSDYELLLDMMRQKKVYPILSEDLAHQIEGVKVFLLPIKKYLVFNNQIIWKKGPMRSDYTQDFIDFVKKTLKTA